MRALGEENSERTQVVTFWLDHKKFVKRKLGETPRKYYFHSAELESPDLAAAVPRQAKDRNEKTFLQTEPHNGLFETLSKS